MTTPTTVEETIKPQIKFATELTVLEKTFAGAIQFLKSTKVDSSPSAKSLFELPWFLVLGGPQTGKSSLLAHSSLNFILTKKSTVSGKAIPTTRHCDLWVSREAVFFDTSGQFTLHDTASQGSAQLWEHFLELLFKEKKDPIQGVLLILSLERLALQSKDEQSWHFQNIAARLDELRNKQVNTAPIYLVLTKADCLAGFSEYFDDLSPEEREQPWGFSFNEDELNTAQTLVDTFTLKFNSLIQNLNERLMARLHSERDWQRRFSVKDFPLQIESLKKTLSYFLHKQVNNFTAVSTFVLRGIYFTSAIPEEYVIDRLLKPLSQGFALTHYTRPILAPQRQTREPFFIKNLFRKIILSDQKTFNLHKQLAQFTGKLWRRRLMLATLGTVVVAAFLYWGYYVSQNVKHVAIAEKALTRYQFLITNVPKEGLSTQQSFSAINSLFDVQNSLEKMRAPALLQWASRDHAQNIEQQQAFSLGLQKTMSWQLTQILTQELAQSQPAPATIYGALKTYYAINNPRAFTKNYAATWLINYWQAKFHPNAQQLATISMHLKKISTLPKINLPNDLLMQANNFLTTLAPEKLITAMLDTDYSLKYAPLSIKLPDTDTLFAVTTSTTQYSIPPQFTRKNFIDIYQQQLPQYLQQLQQGQSILKNIAMPAMSTDELLQKVRDEYMTQYIAVWQTLLQKLILTNSADLTKVQAALAQMLNAHSALSIALNMIQDNTYVLYQNMPTPISLAFAGTAAVPAAKLDQSWYHDLTRLRHLVESVNAAPHPAEKAFSLAAYRMHNENAADILSDLQDKAALLPAPWQAWSQQIVADTWQGLLAQSQSYISDAWQKQVLSAYQHNLANNFPLTATKISGPARQDFTKFFAVNGTFNNFMQQYLDAFIDRSETAPWKLKTRDQAGLKLSPDTLSALQQIASMTPLFVNDNADLTAAQLALLSLLPDDIRAVK